MSERLVPLLARPDLRIKVIHYRGEESVVIKDTVRLKYFRLQPEQASLLALLDRPRTLDELLKKVQKNFPNLHVEKRDVVLLLQDLHDKGLLLTHRYGQSLRLYWKENQQMLQKVFKSFLNPFYIRLAGWDPDWLLTILTKRFGWVFRRSAVVSILTWLTACVFFALMHKEEISRRMPTFQQFFGPSNLIYLWALFGITKLVHEFGHGMACKRFGGECRDMGLVLIVFSPTMYCDTSDSWLFSNRLHRIAVASAGIYFELVFASLAMVCWWHCSPGLLENLCLNVFWLTAASTVVFNANPLMRYDGYFVLSDLLGVPNLQTKATHTIQRFLAKLFLGIKINEDPSHTFLDHMAFGLYGVLAFVYRFVVVAGAAVFLYSILKPYRVESAGLLMSGLNILSASSQGGYRWYKLLNAPRNEPVKRERLWLGALAIGLIVSGATLIPIPWYLDAPFHLQLVDSEVLKVDVPGKAVQLFVKPGDVVQEGQPILQLVNEALDDTIRDLQSKLEVAKIDESQAKEMENLPEVIVARQQQVSIQRELDYAIYSRSRTLVSAKKSGIVFEVPTQNRSQEQDLRGRMRTWKGTPLDKRNLGAWLQRQTEVCVIAPSEKFEAVVLIDQADFPRMLEKKRVRLQLDCDAHSRIETQIGTASIRTMEFAPRNLSVKFGGSIPTEVTEEGMEKMAHQMLQASMPIGTTETPLRLGMRGQARIIVDEFSAVGWATRWIWLTFRFRK